VKLILRLIMKKLIILLFIAVLAVSCKKIERTSIGPTDIRIRNSTASILSELTVETGGGTFNYGILKKDSVSVYHRFEKAYVKANITAVINGQKYKSDTAIYTYMQYLGPDKVTYVVTANDAQKKLIIANVIHESPIK
jgi:hypothetical protein